MENKLCLITGANSGVGKATTTKLAELNAQIVMVVRNKQKGETVKNEIIQLTKNNNIDLMICDFASQNSIRNFAENFLAKYNHLDILINNHGVMLPHKILTEDEIESTFAINHLGYFLLTNLLLDLLKSGSQTRIINVSSGAHAAVRSNPFNDYNYNNRKFSGFKAYAESKLANIMFTYYLADKIKKEKITVNTYSPGFTRTNFARDYKLMRIANLLMFPFSHSAEKGAKTGVCLASSSQLSEVTGKYFIKGKIKKTSKLSYNKEFQKQLWDLSSKLTNL